MSWSVSLIGKVDKVVEALQKQSTNLSGQSKEEYDQALPHLIALAEGNVQLDGAVIRITGNGHASINGGVKTDGHLSVNIERVYGLLV